MEFTFVLKYQLSNEDDDMDALVERLGEAGCDDALVGTGQPGRLALEFVREAPTGRSYGPRKLISERYVELPERTRPLRSRDRNGSSVVRVSSLAPWSFDQGTIRIGMIALIHPPADSQPDLPKD